jgi:hypothetical protein
MLQVRTMMLLATYLKLQFGGPARLGRVTLAFHAAALTRRTRQARLSSLAGSDALCLRSPPPFGLLAGGSARRRDHEYISRPLLG